MCPELVELPACRISKTQVELERKQAPVDDSTTSSIQEMLQAGDILPPFTYLCRQLVPEAKLAQFHLVLRRRSMDIPAQICRANEQMRQPYAEQP